MTKPQKGTGNFRHCYSGQETNLLNGLKQRGITLDEFNHIWDNIEKRNRNHQSENHEDTNYRQEIARRITRQLHDAINQNPPHNLFVPTTAPRYTEMLQRGGTPGHSLEDQTRPGVWIPLQWYLAQPKTR